MLINGVEIFPRGNKNIKLTIHQGHFATSHAHVDHYMSMTDIRTDCKMAFEAARELAKAYYLTPIDTIVCLEFTQIIGAFIAYDLTSAGSRGINRGAEIRLVTPQINSNSQLVFNSDVQSRITNKRVLMLLSTISTGRSLARAAECITYYGGHLVGIASIFSALNSSGGLPISRIFCPDDLGEYHSYNSNECPLCQKGRKLDGMVDIGGYTRI